MLAKSLVGLIEFFCCSLEGFIGGFFSFEWFKGYVGSYVGETVGGVAVVRECVVI
jgi:hypothetical protein